jgi:phage tail sheath protein FI
MPVTEYLSAGVYGQEVNPARAPDNFSPAKAGFVGWTEMGPTNYPIQVRSVEDFTRVFGSYTTMGIIPQEIRGYFSTGGQMAWVSRVAPVDAVSASVAIDAIPGPAKWTFVANGAGAWGNGLAVLIQGNINYLDPVTNQWDAFDLKILQPSDFNPAFQDATEVYEQIQFSDPTQSNYVLNVIADPRMPSLLVQLLVGVGGTPSALLPLTVTGELVGTGGGAPLASEFVYNILNVPVLANTLMLYAISGTTYYLPTSPSAGAINGSNTAFTLQLTNLPIVAGSPRIFYQKKSIADEVEVASSGLINGSNSTFIFNPGTIKNPVHRETTVFSLMYAGSVATPQTLSTTGVTPAVYNLSGTPLATTPVHPGTVTITVNVNGVGLATITDNGQGNLIGSQGSLPGGGTINYSTGVMTGTTAVLFPGSTVVATYDQSNVITKTSVQTLNLTTVVGTISPGDALTQGLHRGTVLSFASGVARVALTTPFTAFTNAAITDTTSSATATVVSNYFNDLEVGVPLIGSVNSGGINTIDLVNSQTTEPPTSGAIYVETLVPPIAGTFFYLNYVALGNVYANTSGSLLGDATQSSTVDFDIGIVNLTTTAAPLTGSTIDVWYQTGQFAQDNGLGQIVGDVNALGNNVINYTTGALDFTWATPPPSATPVTANYVKLAQAVQYQLSGGSNGSVITRNDISNPDLATNYQGIYALDMVEEPLNVVVSDFAGSAFVQEDIVAFCDARQTRYAILAFANGTTVAEAIQYVQVTVAFDTNNAAIYSPNIYFLNDSTGLPELLPIDGFIAGIYSNTATNKNVGKAPAGIVDGALNAAAIVGPEYKLVRPDQDNLYQSRINPVPTSAATGYYVNGARSLSLDPNWRYINARLLFQFLIFNTQLQLQWTLFENNGPALWLKIETALKGYYNSLFRLGYFGAQSADQAFFIKCNASNNNQTTIDNGQVIIDIGFTPGFPCEFVVFKLSQPAGTATGT